MNFEKWKDVAELVALIAVVASLLLVALELRQTQSALQAQTYQQRAFDAIQMHMQLAAQPELTPPGFFNGELLPEQLTDLERETAESLLIAMMIDADNEHYQYQQGFLNEDFYIGDTVLTIEMFAPLWRRFGITESRPEFRAEVDRILSDAGLD